MMAELSAAIRANGDVRGWLVNGVFTVLSLARWCMMTIDEFGGGEFSTVEDLAEYMRLEFRMVGEQHARAVSYTHLTLPTKA